MTFKGPRVQGRFGCSRIAQGAQHSSTRFWGFGVLGLGSRMFRGLGF